MSAARRRVPEPGPERDESLPPLLPPRFAPIPRSLRHREFDPNDRSTWGDQSIVLDEEDERILDKVWAEVARHPRMATDPDAPATNGASTNGRQNRRRRAAVDEDDAEMAENKPIAAGAVPRRVAE
jgi:hypothetical protein